MYVYVMYVCIVCYAAEPIKPRELKLNLYDTLSFTQQIYLIYAVGRTVVPTSLHSIES